jgi:hypothetical protein
MGGTGADQLEWLVFGKKLKSALFRVCQMQFLVVSTNLLIKVPPLIAAVQPAPTLEQVVAYRANYR